MGKRGVPVQQYRFRLTSVSKRVGYVSGRPPGLLPGRSTEPPDLLGYTRPQEEAPVADQGEPDPQGRGWSRFGIVSSLRIELTDRSLDDAELDASRTAWQHDDGCGVGLGAIVLNSESGGVQGAVFDPMVVNRAPCPFAEAPVRRRMKHWSP